MVLAMHRITPLTRFLLTNGPLLLDMQNSVAYELTQVTLSGMPITRAKTLSCISLFQGLSS